MKTLAELKREVNKGNLYFEMVYRYGEEIPERCKGIRRGVRANSVAIYIETQDGKQSELRIPYASLMEYDGNRLVIYQAGQRDLTEQEQAVLNSLKTAESEYYKANPYGDYFWQKQAYFKSHKEFYHLAGWESHNGKYYRNGKVTDSAIKGKKILEYKITRQ